jgi:hypothetical protein
MSVRKNRLFCWLNDSAGAGCLTVPPLFWNRHCRLLFDCSLDLMNSEVLDELNQQSAGRMEMLSVD